MQINNVILNHPHFLFLFIFVWEPGLAKTFLRLEKRPEHFQMKDLQFCNLQCNYVTCIVWSATVEC